MSQILLNLGQIISVLIMQSIHSQLEDKILSLKKER